MAESRMELFIETLTGTAFELSCSPLETIVSIKAKIQYSEGIPVSQQHLIWKSQELNDDLCLQDYSINDGATLKLVLGMKGGPINTRQDTRKLKDLTDLVERNSETGGSEGRPLTVLVFHDGDRVHMYYTLIKRGEYTVSPMSEAISETSSVASIKHIEEFDQDIAREHETTREKVAQLQEQLKSLNINRPKRVVTNSIHASNISLQRKTSDKEDFRLPPIGALTSSSLNAHKSRFSPLEAVSTKDKSTALKAAKTQTALDFVANNISTYILASPDTGSCSNFLPCITPSSSLVERDSFLQDFGPGTIVKRDLSRRGPFTSSQAMAPRKLVDLDVWLRARPKTSPTKAKCNGGQNLSKDHPVSRLESKSKQTVQHEGFKSEISSYSLSNAALGGIFSSRSKALKPLNEPDRREDSDNSGIKNLFKYTEESIKFPSATKLPLIKPKKKSHKRCFQCSRKTGLATSYTCRCGKNFCASHRYAEVHNCSYDYKTEGRRLLQLNNPVVTASKLPKI